MPLVLTQIALLLKCFDDDDRDSQRSSSEILEAGLFKEGSPQKNCAKPPVYYNRIQTCYSRIDLELGHFSQFAQELILESQMS
uniref:Uncharacterized protein n=1 Tax=Physcomitrium patens TaxID=3218 RepID=A0A2K1IN45_PHYPA|nr:hypothetical protein PHYPA_027010 [Physcomitrium patens]